MDPDLLDVMKRYAIVGVVLAASVVWAVEYTTDATRQANTAPAYEARVALDDAGPAGADSASSDFHVVRHGLRRTSCAAACALEAACGLRALEACVNESCDGDVRKLNKSDLQLDESTTCAELQALPCEEACWRQAECSDDHTNDAACTEGCNKLMQKDPATTWQQARCMLETRSCPEVAACRD